MFTILGITGNVGDATAQALLAAREKSEVSCVTNRKLHTLQNNVSNW